MMRYRAWWLQKRLRILTLGLVLLVTSIFFLWIPPFSDAQSSLCTAPPPNLIGWWPGDGNANDIIGNNNGILQNGTTFSPGKVDQAFIFDGANDYVTIQGINTNTPQLTYEAWVYSFSFNSWSWNDILVAGNTTSEASYRNMIVRT